MAASHLPTPVLKFGIVAGLLAMIFLHLAAAYLVRDQVLDGYPDFIIFYTAGTLLRTGRAADLYDLQLQNQLEQQVAPHVTIRQGPLPFNHPSFEALLFFPLSYFPYRSAYLTWAAINLLLVLASARLLQSDFPALHRFVPSSLLLACFGFFPVFVALLQGQDSILLLFLYVLSLRSWNAGRRFFSGAWLALGLFKPQLVLPVAALFLLRKQWRFLVGFSAVAGVLTGVSIGVVGWNAVLSYPQFLSSLNHGGWGIVPLSMPNLRGFLSLIDGNFAFRKSALLLIIVISAICIFVASRYVETESGKKYIRGFSLAIVVAVIVSYHLNAHDLSILVVPLFLIAELCIADALPRNLRNFNAALLALWFFSPLEFWFWLGVHRLSLMFIPVLLLAAGLILTMRSGRQAVATQLQSA